MDDAAHAEQPRGLQHVEQALQVDQVRPVVAVAVLGAGAVHGRVDDGVRALDGGVDGLVVADVGVDGLTIPVAVDLPQVVPGAGTVVDGAHLVAVLQVGQDGAAGPAGGAEDGDVHRFLLPHPLQELFPRAAEGVGVVDSVDLVVLGLRPGQDVVEGPPPRPAQEHEDEQGEDGVEGDPELEHEAQSCGRTRGLATRSGAGPASCGRTRRLQPGPVRIPPQCHRPEPSAPPQVSAGGHSCIASDQPPAMRESFRVPQLHVGEGVPPGGAVVASLNGAGRPLTGTAPAGPRKEREGPCWLTT